MHNVSTPDRRQPTAWPNATNLVRVPSPANGIAREDVDLFVAWRLSYWLEPSLVQASAERQTLIPHNASDPPADGSGFKCTCKCETMKNGGITFSKTRSCQILSVVPSSFIAEPGGVSSSRLLQFRKTVHRANVTPSKPALNFPSPPSSRRSSRSYSTPPTSSHSLPPLHILTPSHSLLPRTHPQQP